MKSSDLRIGYPVYKRGKLICVTVDILGEIYEEQEKPEGERAYGRVPLNATWLQLLGFEAKAHPISKAIHYTHVETGLKVTASQKGTFSLGYPLKERMPGMELTYYVELVYLVRNG